MVVASHLLSIFPSVLVLVLFFVIATYPSTCSSFNVDNVGAAISSRKRLLSLSPKSSTTSTTIVATRIAWSSLIIRAGASGSNSETIDEVTVTTDDEDNDNDKDLNGIFEDFVQFLEQKQHDIIQTIEEMDGSGRKFTNDPWGLYVEEQDRDETIMSGGRTRVLQGGDIVEKGACSLTLIKRGVLTAQRAEAIRSRQSYKSKNSNDKNSQGGKDDSVGEEEEEEEGSSNMVRAGDTYAAAALSIVLHSRSPFIPTFRSDVRIFMVESASTSPGEEEGKEDSSSTPRRIAFFGGGADLTPYYLGDSTTNQDFADDITSFHNMYRDLATHKYPVSGFDYPTLKELCDKYFYLPARSEHRGTGGIFFDDLDADMPNAVDFVKGVANTWMPSWLPIIEKRRDISYTDQQKQWQLLRRGRYLEFNLLYDRGVAFGLQVPNPRVEGVMVSAPPLIAWEYNHQILDGSEEARIMDVLKNPVDWAT